MPIYEKDVADFLPDNCAKDICGLLNGQGILLHITRDRLSKLGDFVVNQRTNRLKISINASLDKYSFLITLIHEIAHLYIWKKYKNTVKPHGIEWKNMFRELITPFLQKNIFPHEIQKALQNYCINPSASTNNHPELFKALLPYSKKNNFITIEHLPENAIFMLPNGLTFKKIKLIKKRYECLCLNNKKKYSVSPNAIVTPIDT